MQMNRFFNTNPVKYYFILILFTLTSFKGNEKWAFDTEKSSVIFIAKNIGMRVTGTIKGMKIESNFNGTDIINARFNGSIQVNTIDTKNKMRDKHLRSSDYFDTEKYPTISFKSDKVITNGSSLAMKGNLTIKKTTKEVLIPFTIEENGNQKILTGEVNILRKDFELGSNTTLIMADEIKVRIIATFIK